MEGFKKIAVDCLAGKLSGTFILRNGLHISSKNFTRNDGSSSQEDEYPYAIYYKNEQYTYTTHGHIYSCRTFKNSDYDIVNFIPDKNIKQENLNIKQENNQIKIDIPEGMEVVQEIVDGEIRIKFVEKKLTYNDILKKLVYTNEEIQGCSSNDNSKSFYKKAEVIRKLTNIRNYLGKPESGKMGYCIIKNGDGKITIINVNGTNPHFVVFKTAEHAKEAINLIGYDKLKCLFESW